MKKKTVKYNKTGPAKISFTLPRELYERFTECRIKEGRTKDMAAAVAIQDWIDKEKGD